MFSQPRSGRFYIRLFGAPLVLMFSSAITLGAAQGGPTNCQPGTAPTDGLAYMSDLSAFGDGIVAADDFVPAGDTISKVTVWGVYLDPTGPSETGPTGQEQFNCAGRVTERFRVRVLTPAEFSQITVVGESEVTGSNIESVLESAANTPQFFSRYGIPFTRHTLTLDAAITGLIPGETYWLEVAGATFDPAPNDCEWHWAQHLPTDRDAYCITGISPGATSANILGNSFVYGQGERGGVDLAFCLESPGGPLSFQAPPVPVAACWTCGDDGSAPTCTLETLRTCTNLGRGWDRAQTTCQFPLFLSFLDCCTGSCHCLPGEGCAGEPIIVGTGFFTATNTCMTNDGPLEVSDEFGGTFSMDNDLWYHFPATCTGTLVVDTCATQTAFTQDGFTGLNVGVALYHDFDDPFDLVCPGSTAEVSPFQAGAGADDNCNGIADAGGGIIRQSTLRGEWWTIRVGGASTAMGPAAATQGRGFVNIRCESNEFCHLAAAPEPALTANSSGALVVETANRFLAFSIAETTEQAIRVTFVDLPPPFDSWNGVQMWVGPPDIVSELPGRGWNDPTDGGATFLIATLQCQPHYADWSAFGTVHVHHEAIAPSRRAPGGGIAHLAAYDIQAINKAFCQETVEDHFSPPLALTTSLWADVAGANLGDGFTASDNRVDVAIDVVALLAKFAGKAIAPSKFRFDLEPARLDGKITVSDLLSVLKAFSGSPYPHAPPEPPCP